MSLSAAAQEFLAERRNVVVAGIRSDGRPSMTPNWFHFDGELFYVSTTRNRAKYKLFRRDARVQLLVDDATGHRYLRLDGTVEIWEDLDRILPYARAVREKYGREVGSDADLKASLTAEDRVMLVIRPDGPTERWDVVGL
jgi:PPOX class probable F420-dependent enzyme